MVRKTTKKSNFIPSPFKAVNEYENEFIRQWNSNTAEAIGNVLKYVAKATAFAIKNNEVDVEIEKAYQEGDIHPNGKWIYKEYKPGKFDWRAIPKGNKTASNVWDMVPEIGKCISVDDCLRILFKNKIVTVQSNLGKCDIETAKKISSTLINLNKRFKFEPITLGFRDLGSGTFMFASNGERVVMNSKYFTNFDDNRAFDDSVGKYTEKIDKAISSIDYNIKNAARFKITDTTNLKAKKDELERSKKKFSKWINIHKESVAQDIIIHEMGHILNAQCTGGCSHRFVCDRSEEYMKNAKRLNEKRNEMFLAHKDESECISRYSTTKPAEFFAEAFVAYVHGDKMPKYVKDFMDDYFKTTTPKI